MKTVKSIVENYKSDLKALINEELELIINKDWDECDESLEIIYCGDNPGKTEKEVSRYFVGSAGKELDIFIQLNNKLLKKKKFTFFNKTPFFSNRTNQINRRPNTNEIVIKSIQLTVRCLYEIWRIKNIPIFIFGINRKAFIVETFFLELRKINDEGFKKSIMVLNHPSNNSLFGAFGKQLLTEFNDNGFEISISYEEFLEKCSRNDFL